jgi:hypothetical protein
MIRIMPQLDWLIGIAAFYALYRTGVSLRVPAIIAKLPELLRKP